MAHDAPAAASSGKTVIRNIGLLLSGAMENPILDSDTIVAVDGRIAAVGREKDVDIEGATTVIDAKGTVVAPGLIDSHVHPVSGDWTPRQNQLGWIEFDAARRRHHHDLGGRGASAGRPRDIVGLKAHAITAQRTFSAFRVSGVKLHAGAPVIEPGMVEQDFKELAEAGVKLLGEVGLGGVKDGANARRMVAWARKYGIQSTIHTGGPSIPGSGLIGADVVLEADTDVVGHVNGGHTALPDKEIRCICEGCKRGLELVHNGNERSALFTLRTARELGELDRVILGTDGPAGSGVQPLGIVRMIAMLSSLGDAPRRDRLLLRHRQYGADAGAGLRPHRGRPRGRFRLHGQSPAFGRKELPRFDSSRRSAWRRHDDDRRNRQDGPKPEYPAGGEDSRSCRPLRRACAPAPADYWVASSPGPGSAERGVQFRPRVLSFQGVGRLFLPVRDRRAAIASANAPIGRTNIILNLWKLKSSDNGGAP